MLKFLKISCFLLMLNLGSCKKETLIIETTDSNLKLENDMLTYKQAPFSGVLQTKTDTLITYRANFLNGKKHGEEKKFYYNGKIASIREYTDGKKTGIHQAWWNDQKLKFKRQFDSLGNFHGQQLEWHSNGQLLKESNYINGEEEGPQKLWSRDGNIKANYTVVNGDRYGLISSNKCKAKDNELQ